MATATSEQEATLALKDVPAEEARPSEAVTGVLHRLRAAFATYRTENSRGWSDLVEDQARNPTID